LTSTSPIVWRIAAAVLWIASIACLFHAITVAANVEGWSTSAPLSSADHLALEHQTQIADNWAAIGWFLQFATAAVLSFGIRAARVVRRIFVSLGVLIAVDGVSLLLLAVIVR
jgi:hypothetical protein